MQEARYYNKGGVKSTPTFILPRNAGEERGGGDFTALHGAAGFRHTRESGYPG